MTGQAASWGIERVHEPAPRKGGRWHRGQLTSAARLLVLALTVCSAALAQGNRVIHVWVDPHYGDDAKAVSAALPTNPIAGIAGPPRHCTAGEDTPADVQNSTQKPLLHAPWPFRTIGAAVSYVPPLPYSGQHGTVWEYAIVHLMPGKYSSDTFADFHNQQESSLDSFPIDVPDRVSIQGASALNTVIDLGASRQGTPEGPAFRFGQVSTSTGAFSTISHLSIHGGAYNANNPEESAAIYCARNYASTPTIANCFLFANGVGVLVDADLNGDVEHSVTLVNNTIAMNGVGVWNGQSGAFVLGVFSSGVSKVMLVNNILDSGNLSSLQGDPNCSSPIPDTFRRWVAGSLLPPSAFEGVDTSDLTTSGGVDSNAYAAGLGSNYNIVGVPTSPPHTNISLPATKPRSTSPMTPGVDIGPITGAGNPVVSRGVLYIRDLFFNGAPFHLNVGGNGTQTCDFDLSPGDFRLAPSVALAHTGSQPNEPGGPNGMPNPLVDVGVSTLPVTMQNGMSLSSGPGLLPLPNSTWTYDQWFQGATDAEGYGNPRIVDHRLTSAFPGTGIDIGADEVDILIVGGHRFGTTMFTENQQDQNDSRYLWMFGPALASPGVVPLPLPVCKLWTTPTPAGMLTWGFAYNTNYYNPRVVDITPHLLPDVHPWHAKTTSPVWPSNPIWQDCGGLQPLHNSFLFLDPWAPIANPPGSLIAPFTPVNLNWLDGFQLLPLYPALPLFSLPVPIPSSGPVWFDKFGSWCQNPATSLGTEDWIDVRAMLSLLGLANNSDAGRLTIEIPNHPTEMLWWTPEGPGSNMQSFMIFKQ